jgi:tRNA pseudouridine55 synthase
MDGVIVIDKPDGLTSHDVVAAARRCLGEPRIGHTGTLDPMATGVLPLACGRATRLVRFLSASTKDYDATVRFGMTTDSYDVTGQETSRSGCVPSAAQVEEALWSLRGEYLQTPPAFSAKKVSGQRAYALARQQRHVTLEALPVRVSRADLIAVAGDTATIALTCSAGFYVRSFAHALGGAVGTGACLAGLRRTRSGEFTLEQAVSLAALQQGDAGSPTAVIPMRRLLSEMAEVRVTEEGRTRVVHGRDLHPEHLAGDRRAAAEGTTHVRLLDGAGELIAIATVTGAGALHPAVVLI